jgi:tetratricopeptide (TPR) repeat protein
MSAWSPGRAHDLRAKVSAPTATSFPGKAEGGPDCSLAKELSTRPGVPSLATPLGPAQAVTKIVAVIPTGAVPRTAAPEDSADRSAYQSTLRMRLGQTSTVGAVDPATSRRSAIKKMVSRRARFGKIGAENAPAQAVRIEKLLLSFLIFAAVSAGVAWIASPIAAHAEALESCNNSRLRQVVLTESKDSPGRPAELERLLACLGASAAPMTAAGAAYELAMHFAGADGGVADLRRAATWARRSLDYLKNVTDWNLRRRTELGALRLEYYAAANQDELRAASMEFEAFVGGCRARRDANEVCSEALMLLGEALRDRISDGAEPIRKDAIDSFRLFLLSPLGQKRGSSRASALLDKGTLIGQTPETSLAPSQMEEAEAALREARSIFQDEGDLERKTLAELNLAAFLAQHRSANAAALEEAEALLRPLINPSNKGISAAGQMVAKRDLGSVLTKKQTGNHQKNIEEAIPLLREVLTGAQEGDARAQIKASVNLALALDASGLRQAENLDEAERVLEAALDKIEQAKLRPEAAEALSTLVTVKLHRLVIGEDENLSTIGGLLSRAQAFADHGKVEQARLAALAADYYQAKAGDGDLGSLDAAIQELRRALGLIDRRLEPELWATLQNNLGNLCSNRRRPDLNRCAVEAYMNALSVRTAEAMPREHTDTVVNLANLRFNQRDWRTASELYEQAAAASRARFDPALPQQRR